jgi:hypothetical protein
VATFVGDTGAGAAGGIAFTPGGTLYQAAYNSLLDFFSLNTLSPADASRLATVAIGFYVDGLAVRPGDGTIFATPGNSDEIHTLDPITGLETFVGSTGAGSPGDLAFRPAPVPEPGSPMLLGIVVLGLIGGCGTERTGRAVGSNKRSGGRSFPIASEPRGGSRHSGSAA